MRKRIIYKITNPNGRIYIGQTLNLYNRKFAYKGLHCKDQPKIYNSIKKYGWENHKFEILFEFETSQDIINELEILYIKYYNSNNSFNLNICEGGLGHSGHKHSEETKQKIREARFNNVNKIKYDHLLTSENREKGRLSKINNLKSGKTKPPRLGVKLSEDVKEKIRNSLKKYYENTNLERK